VVTLAPDTRHAGWLDARVIEEITITFNSQANVPNDFNIVDGTVSFHVLVKSSGV
jgi:hypothetical protein